MFDDASILVTGGTGSFGNKFAEIVLSEHRPRRLVIFSRDELKQHEMRQRFADERSSPLRFFIGDIRDADRLRRAMQDVDIVIHAAAMKQVPTCEYNPIEAIATNVIGAKNVVDAALDTGVERVLALSTDKAVNPVNLYGATKLCAEKLVIQSNAYSGNKPTKFSCTRYGNISGSRGSVVPTFQEQRKNGRITITDSRMTRFWMSLEDGVRFVMHCIAQMQGGEIFIPKIPSLRITDLADAVAPGCEVEYIGIRPGEKLHEVLVSEDEAQQTLEFDDMYVVQPAYTWWNVEGLAGARSVDEDFRFRSDTNTEWLDTAAIRRLAEGVGLA